MGVSSSEICIFGLFFLITGLVSAETELK
ncbi:uncharacterized protein METZ01_LOCUS337520, partial [marine metagenome]